MSTNRELRKRPLRILKEDDINPANLEKLFGHYEDRIKELDERRINQMSKASEGSTTDETVSNILTALNNLIDALNKSSLTKG